MRRWRGKVEDRPGPLENPNEGVGEVTIEAPAYRLRPEGSLPRRLFSLGKRVVRPVRRDGKH